MSGGVSLLFPAYNRLAYTQQSWAALMANTDWSLVSEFHVYDDGSEDGTWQFLRGQIAGQPPTGFAGNASYQETKFRSPMGITLDWIRRSRSPMLAKLDNDTIYPPGWLNIALDVMERHPELDMLGLECMREPLELDGDRYRIRAQRLGGFVARCDYLPAKFVSGLGLYRRAAFAAGLPKDGGYYGLEEFQIESAKLKTGWILPSLPTILLDRLPIEPWASLSEEYVRRGWQRPWSLELRYKLEQEAIWSWWKAVNL